MLKLSDLGSKNSCLEKIGMDFVESWNLKILVAEKVLIQRGEFKNIAEIKRIENIHERKNKVGISGTIKTGWLRPSQEFHADIPMNEFNQILNSSFPLSGEDLARFDKIKSEYKKYL